MRISKYLTIAVLSSMVAFGSIEKSLADTSRGKKIEEIKKQEAGFDQRMMGELRTERSQNITKMQEVIEQNNIYEKLEYLKTRYGGAMENFLWMNRITRDLEVLDGYLNEQDDPEALVDSSFPIGMTSGSSASGAYQERWTRQELNNRGFEVEGLDSIPDFSEQEFRGTIDMIYTREFYENSCSGVVFIPEIKSRTEGEILVGATDDFTMNNLLSKESGDDLRNSIVLYDRPGGTTKDEFWDTFYHEIYHRNDWNNSSLLTSSERINMLYDVSRRSNQEDRFHSSYVEGIDEEKVLGITSGKTPENTTPEQLTDFIKTVEYWAELGMEYTRRPHSLENDHPDDYKMAEKWTSVLSGL